MVRYYLTLVLFLLATVCLGVAKPAQAEWGLPSLNPFSSQKKAAAEPKQSKGWSLPGLPSLSGGKSRPAGGKSMLTKTKEVIFPWTKSSPPPRKLTGTRRVTNSHTSFASGSSDSGKSYFSSWFSSDENQERRPRSPQEFLGQPLPE